MVPWGDFVPSNGVAIITNPYNPTILGDINWIVYITIMGNIGEYNVTIKVEIHSAKWILESCAPNGIAKPIGCNHPKIHT